MCSDLNASSACAKLLIVRCHCYSSFVVRCVMIQGVGHPDVVCSSKPRSAVTDLGRAHEILFRINALFLMWDYATLDAAPDHKVK
jgi:hypothetical protein